MWLEFSKKNPPRGEEEGLGRGRGGKDVCLVFGKTFLKGVSKGERW